jgi:hypothetical protein
MLFFSDPLPEFLTAGIDASIPWVVDLKRPIEAHNIKMTPGSLAIFTFNALN